VTTFGLIHGAWHGAWCWERLIPELERRGHRAVAVDLFGQPGGGSAIIPSSIPLLYLPPLLLAGLILTGTWFARRRAGERDRQVGSATSGPRSPVSA